MHRRGLVPLLLLIPFLVGFARDEVSRPEDHLLGIRIGMTRPDATEILSEIGFPNETMVGLKEGWELADPRWAHMIVRYGDDEKVRWVTLLARPDSTAVRFADIGDLAEAEQRGYYAYTWSRAPEGDRPGYSVTARGTDPEFVASLSLFPYVPLRQEETPKETPGQKETPGGAGK